MAYTWPTVKAVTTAMDDATDDPNVARPEIKQNVDNVNKIIDAFHSTTPSDDNLWQYNATNTRWEAVTPESVLSTIIGKTMVVLELGNDGSGPSVSGSTQYNTITEHHDTGNLCSINTASSLGNRFTLGSGTYIIKHNGVPHNSDSQAVQFINVTAASTIAQGIVSEIGTTGHSVQQGIDNTVFTSNGTDLLAFQYWGYGFASPNFRDGFKILLQKIA